MSEDALNKCLTFAEGSGSDKGRIGTFGFGLPNSSISVCRRVEVFSRIEGGSWHFVYLDVDEILASRSEYQEAVRMSKAPQLGFEIKSNVKTIIRWTNLDKCDAARAKTLIRRTDKLLGRLYRYFIGSRQISLHLISRNLENKKEDTNQRVIENDPLFLATNRYHATDTIWKEATRSDGKHKHPQLGDSDPYFNPITHYSRFITGCENGQSQLPLFQKCREFWDVPYQVPIGTFNFEYKLRAAYANSGITNPGLRSGGRTDIGMLIGQKMDGTQDCKSANIFWIREGRELDFGSYSLYKPSDVKQRFWTIEIHFDHSLDEILGVSNTKQSVDFYRVDGDIDEIDTLRGSVSVQEARQRLFNHITEQCLACIKFMNTQLNKYAKDFLTKEHEALRTDQRENKPIPEVEGTVFRSLPKDGEWTVEQKEEVVSFLKTRYSTIPLKAIQNQINIAAKGLTSTVVLYAPNETGNMFDIEPARGKFITIINSRHPFYEKVLEPIKKHIKLVDFTISMEMLISAMAVQKHDIEMKQGDAAILDFYLQQISSQLQLWIKKNNIQIDTDKFANSSESSTET
jgi:hypothetical protein